MKNPQGRMSLRTCILNMRPLAPIAYEGSVLIIHANNNEDLSRSQHKYSSTSRVEYRDIDYYPSKAS